VVNLGFCSYSKTRQESMLKRALCLYFHPPLRSFRPARYSCVSAAITPNRHTPVDIDDWVHNENYHNKLVLKQDSVLQNILDNSERHGLPYLHLSEAQGKFLNLLVRSLSASRVLEVGTLGGYSTAWIAKALPSYGKLVSLEISEKYAQVHLSRIVLVLRWQHLFSLGRQGEPRTSTSVFTCRHHHWSRSRQDQIDPLRSPV